MCIRDSYKTIKRANGYSLLELDLETGRKNQIRVHMQNLSLIHICSLNSYKIPVNGTMISGCVSTPSFFSSRAAPKIARVCI